MPTHMFLRTPVFSETEDEIVARLTAFYRRLVLTRRLRKAAEGGQLALPMGLPEMEADPDDAALEAMLEREALPLPHRTRRRIERRASRLQAARDRAMGTAHLSRDEMQQIKPVLDGARLAGPDGLDAVDELGAQLMLDMPWMQPAILEVWQVMRANVQAGRPALPLPPILLNGPPGVGKSHFARRLAELCCVPVETIEVGSGQAGFRVAGLERGWGSAMAGRPVQMILRTGVSNPMIVLDELCKAKPIADRSGVATIQESLLSLLEPATSADWMCPYFQLRFDMSRVSWIMTSNTLETVPEPLLNRVRVIELSPLSPDDLVGFAKSECERRNLGQPVRKAVIKAIRSVGHARRDVSLRGIVRMVDRAEMAERRPPLH